MDVGLVDKLGVLYDAKIELEQLSKVSKPIWNKEDPFEKIMKKLSTSSNALLHTYFPTLILK